MRAALLALSALLPASAAAADWLTWERAVPLSRKAGKPVLLDFQAPWCYSCYYMDERVLSRPRFMRAAEGLVLAKVDVDTAEGAALRSRKSVSFLPTYVLLSPGGEREIGRVIGEQTEDDFHAKLSALLAGRQTDDQDLLDRYRRAEAGDLAPLDEALRRPPDCRLPLLVSGALPKTSALPPARRQALLLSARALLEELARTRLLAPPAARCADMRTGVEAYAGVLQELGDAPARAAFLKKAADLVESDQTRAGLDRARDDDLRAILELLGDERRLRAHAAGLIKAYPKDFVFPYRWAEWLAKNGRHAEALKWADKAAPLAYGGNRLRIAAAKALALAGLGRREEAKALLAAAFAASRGRFPKDEERARGVAGDLAPPAR